MSTSIERIVIERALALMDAGWTHDQYAADATGKEVAYWSKKAVAFCAVGAIFRATLEVTGKRNMKLARGIEERLDDSLGRSYGNIVGLNDWIGKASVTRALTKRLAEL